MEEVAEQLEQVSAHVEFVDTDCLESIVHILNDIVNTNTSEEQVWNWKFNESELVVKSYGKICYINNSPKMKNLTKY